MPNTDLGEKTYYLTIGEVHSRLRNREISATDLTNETLSRIDAVNPRLNAFAVVLADRARQDAARADAEIAAGQSRGPLHGVPVGIKDFYDTAGIKTTAASDRFLNRTPQADAVSVTRLKDAGAVIVGKMNMHTLGMGTTGLDSAFGPAKNPWSERHIPGGSSSGSAAAVAAGLCWATLDTDAVGSCRLPAACCGVVGFKGTYDLISTRGILEGEKADDVILKLSHAGVTTRCAADSAVLLAALVPGGSVSAPRTRLRVGVADSVKADPVVMRACRAAADVIASLGHETVAAAASLQTPPFGDLHSIDADRKSISGRAFSDIDVFILPTLPGRVPLVDAVRGHAQGLSAALTMFANYFGLPAISVPCGFDEGGLPLAFQIVGKPRDDSTVLELAAQYEAGRPETVRHPIP